MQHVDVLRGGATDVEAAPSSTLGPAPVGIAFVDNATGVAVAGSDRVAEPTMNQTMMLVDAMRVRAGAPTTVVGKITVGAFPREMDADTGALFVSGFDSNSISGLDLTVLTLPRARSAAAPRGAQRVRKQRVARRSVDRAQGAARSTTRSRQRCGRTRPRLRSRAGTYNVRKAWRACPGSRS